MRRTLRATGEPVSLYRKAAAIDDVWPLPDAYERRWYTSGTAALAAASVACSTRLAKSGTQGRPEFIVPAYTCPDVVSAIVYAGGFAVPCDFDGGLPRLDLTMLSSQINRQTAAIIAVNFQGIPENIPALRELATAHGVPIIYDHCQGAPYEAPTDSGVEFLVFSFGRGKPASALCGGALAISRAAGGDYLAALPKPTGQVDATPLTKRALYDLAIHPLIYGLALRLPGLNIGQTVYKPLAAITGLSGSAISQIATAISDYRAMTARRLEVRNAYSAELKSSWDLVALCEVDKTRSLLRYPVQCPNYDGRERALKALTVAGLGASCMYPGLLTEIPQARDYCRGEGSLDNAFAFSRRFLTLPVHTAVRHSDVRRSAQILRNHCA
jgi:dTDP-4-amino-4,6-dideoxygalactose transaminase